MDVKKTWYSSFEPIDGSREMLQQLKAAQNDDVNNSFEIDGIFLKKKKKMDFIKNLNHHTVGDCYCRGENFLSSEYRLKYTFPDIDC